MFLWLCGKVLWHLRAPEEATIEAADDLEAGQEAGGQLAVQAEARPLPIEADPRLAIEGPHMAVAIRPEGIIAQQQEAGQVAAAEKTAERGCLAQFVAFFSSFARRGASTLARRSAQELEHLARKIEA